LGDPELWRGAALSPDGGTLATTTRGQALLLWDVGSWRMRLPAGPPLWPVRSLAFTPDGGTLFTGSAAPQPSARCALRLGLFGRGADLVYEQGALGSPSDAVRGWDAAGGRERPPLPGRPTMAQPELLALSPDGRTLAAGGRDGGVWLWDVRERRLLRRVFVSARAQEYARATELARLVACKPSYPEAVRALAFSPDGATLALAGTRGTVTLWQTDGWRQRGTLPGDHRGLAWLRFSPDGRTLATGEGGRVRLWDARTLEPRRALGEAGDSPSLCGAFSPDGTFLVSGTAERGLRGWDLGTGRERPALVGHRDRVTAVAFSPDGRTLASGGWDRAVRLWCVPAWQEAAVLEGHRGRVACLAFSPDGQTLVSGGEWEARGEVRVWRAPRDGGRGAPRTGEGVSRPRPVQRSAMKQ
jgi:WD40 repeat protein